MDTWVKQEVDMGSDENLTEGTALQEKGLFSMRELEAAFKITRKTIVRMIGDIPPIGKRSNFHVWHINHIAELKDTRKPEPLEDAPEKNENYIETDPRKMKAAERKIHFQAVDLEQAANLKLRKNQIEARELIPASEVEIALAVAFKTVALTLDTLPDRLERDGIISSSDMEKVINIVDNARSQLATELTELSPKVELAEMLGDW